jgi:EAL domain-containing protein (putative c-di-GMP-specific phosphodiesterase class I)
LLVSLRGQVCCPVERGDESMALAGKLRPRVITSSPVKQKLVRAMTTLCRDLGITVVAEGIEIVEERDAIVELGCDLLQGYFLAKPGRAFPEVLA